MSKASQEFIEKNKIPKLGFGCMRLPVDSDGQIDIEMFKQMVDEYIAAGFNYFDTAYMYHGGKSEGAVKEAVVKRYPRESFTLVDKLPIWSCETKEDVERVFNEQLEKCGVEYFDIYLLHALNGELNDKHERLGSYEFCERMKKEGKIKNFGFSFHGTTQDMHNIMQRHHEQFDVVQLQINYFDWLRDYKDQYEIVASYNKPIVCMEPVRGGILARLPEKIADILTQANPNASHASWAVRWVGSMPEIITVLSGMSNMEQVHDNIKTCKDFNSLTKAEFEITNKVAQELHSIPQVACTACNYCDICPEGIPIAEIFGIYNKFLADRGMLGFGMAYRKIEKSKNASACTSCGACVEICPQNLNIPERMKEIATLMDA